MAQDDIPSPRPEGNRQEALRRIRQAAGSGQKILDLGDLGLDSLPPELGELTGLRRLSLGRASPFPDREEPVEWKIKLERPKTTLTDLSPLATLSRLEALDLSYAPHGFRT